MGNFVHIDMTQTTSHASVPRYEIPVPIRIKSRSGRDTLLRVNLNPAGFGVAFAGPLPFSADTLWADPYLNLPAKYNLWSGNQGFMVLRFCEATQEIDNLLPAMVYPNPADNVLTIDFQSNSYQKVIATLFNLTGEKVLEKVLTQVQGKIEWQLGQLPAGVYMLKLKDGDKSSVHKIIKSY
jgi:hypothetical protein